MSPKKGKIASDLRRDEALQLLSLGLSAKDVAKKLQVSLRSIRRWISGAELEADTRTLTDDEKLQLHQALLKGRKALGMVSGPWKTEDIQRIVAFFYGIRISPRSVEGFMEGFGWRRLGAGPVWEKPIPPKPGVAETPEKG